MEHFVAGTTARCAAGLVGINFKTAAYYYHRLRMLICLATENKSAFSGEVVGNFTTLLEHGNRSKCFKFL